MNPFEAFAEDDDDDFQQTPTQNKPAKKSKPFLTQPIKKEKQSSNKRSKKPKKHRMLLRSTRTFPATSRKTIEIRDTTKLFLPKKFPPKDTILIAEAELVVMIVPAKKEEVEETLETSMMNSRKTSMKKMLKEKSLLKKPLKKNSQKNQKNSPLTSTIVKRALMSLKDQLVSQSRKEILKPIGSKKRN